MCKVSFSLKGNLVRFMYYNVNGDTCCSLLSHDAYIRVVSFNNLKGLYCRLFFISFMLVKGVLPIPVARFFKGTLYLRIIL